MKPAHTYFRDQVKTLVDWFSNWNECEQTIALYTLLKRISTTQAQFLSLILQHTFRNDTLELQVLQNQANDKKFVTRLRQQSIEEAVTQLLAHLPLLVPGNDEARFEYLQLLPKILAHSVDNCVHQDECMQLLSLALVHPAFPQEERNSLLKWLSHLEKNYSVQEQQRSQLNRHGTTESDIQPNTGIENLVRARSKRTNNMTWTRKQPLTHKDSGLGSSFDATSTYSPSSVQTYGSSFCYGSGIRKSRSNSLTPPPPMDVSQESILEDFNEEQEVEIRKGRSRSFPVDPQRQYQLSPQSSTESEQDDYSRQRGSSFNEEARPGMKDVHGWLKSLRLHKYDSLFQQLSYEEMMALDESYLESKNVTKGARNKILINVQKLSERSEVLQSLEKDVLQVGKLQDVLNEMKQILITPIKPFTPPTGPVTTPTSTNQGIGGNMTEQPVANGLPHPDDLPSQITRVLGKACTQILVSRADEDNCSTYLHLLDRALINEAFTMIQKKRFQSWKQQCLKLARSQFTRRPSQEKSPRGWCHMSHGSGDSSSGIVGPPAGPGGQAGKRHGRAVPRSNKERPANQMRSNSAEQQMHQKPQLTRSHAIIGRTKSLPVKPTQQHSFSLPQQLSADYSDKDPALDGIDNSFETLCLSVTEHALEDSGGN